MKATVTRDQHGIQVSSGKEECDSIIDLQTMEEVIELRDAIDDFLVGELDDIINWG